MVENNVHCCHARAIIQSLLPSMLKSLGNNISRKTKKSV